MKKFYCENECKETKLEALVYGCDKCHRKKVVGETQTELIEFIENKIIVKTFDRKEIQLLISLVEAQKASVNMLRGFRKPNREEQDENAYYNLIINKLKNL